MDYMIQRTEDRFYKKEDRLEKDFGWASTVGPTAITTNFLETLSLEVPKYLIVNNKQEQDFISLIANVPIDTLALCVLNGGLQIIGSNSRGLSAALTRLGRDIEGECYAEGLKAYDEKLSIRLDKLARARHGNLKYRRQAVRSIAKKNGYVCKAWTNKQRIIAGNWGLNLLISVLPQVFSLVTIDGHGSKELGLTEDAFDLANEAIKQAIYANPVWLPEASKPDDWCSWDRPVKRKELTFRNHLIRSRYAETAVLAKDAITSGVMQPALDALNTIQAVPYTINTRVLEVIKYLHTNSIDVEGLPASKDLELPKRTKAWDQMDPDEQKAWKIRASRIKLRNRGLKSERVLLLQDLNTAEYLSQHGKSFYTQCNFDWRGRVYPLPHFNFQREDRVRSLFLFASGQPMTEDGMYWLRVHVANTGDFNKVSKRSFDERVQWVLDNEKLISDIVYNPLECTEWHKADKPFMFLAACMEYVDALVNPEYVTRLPISLDGSCSGLQHLSAMTGAKEGSLVNLTPCDRPQDIYSVVADGVTKSLEATLIDPQASETERTLSRLSLNYGITRSLVKRPTMTYGYSSQKYGMGSQLMEDLMRPLAIEVLAGERDEHPFGEDGGFAASRFLAERIFTTIEQVVHKPAEAMDFLRHLAKAMAHENKPVVWITPIGIPWVNRYHDGANETVNLWLFDKGIRKRHSVLGFVTNNFTKQINKTKASNSVSPNVVHALDASHLMMTVNDLKEVSNVTDVALVHDSFGVHAPNVAILAGALRRQFVRLYSEFDPLQDILRTNEALILDWGRLPKLPSKGPLDIKEVLNAEYAFS